MKGWLLTRTIIAWILVVVDLAWLATTPEYPKSVDLRLFIQHPSFIAHQGGPLLALVSKVSVLALSLLWTRLLYREWKQR
jgi:hypothetical protein